MAAWKIRKNNIIIAIGLPLILYLLKKLPLRAERKGA